MSLAWAIANWRMLVIAALVTTNLLTYELWSASSEGAARLREAMADADAHAKGVVEQQKQINKDTTDGWKAAVDYLHANPQRVLSRYCAGTGVSLPTPGADGASQGTVPPASGASAIPESSAELEADAAKAVLGLNRLQIWIEEQRAVK